MDGVNCLNTLHFHDDQVLDDQIDAIPKFDFFSVENHRQTNLAGHFESAFSEFMGQTALVGALQQSRSENRMDMHCGSDNRARNLIDTKGTK